MTLARSIPFDKTSLLRHPSVATRPSHCLPLTTNDEMTAGRPMCLVYVESLRFFQLQGRLWETTPTLKVATQISTSLGAGKTRKIPELDPSCVSGVSAED
ncbi:hypothetical protein MN608_02901 [Microdochium nivale]|nr:hypothetical protein MN608_02901 [Microdochium nivale]